MENWLTILMAVSGVGGFFVVCAGVGINAGSFMKNASDGDMQGERYQRVDKSKTAAMLYKTGIALMVLSFVFAVILRHGG